MSVIEIYPIDRDSIRFTFQNGTLDIVVRCGDIVFEHCDAIVNPTRPSMSPDGGLDSHVHVSMGQFFTDQVVAIHKDKMNDACPVGQSRIFISKFDLNENDPRFVINTAGPIYNQSDKEKSHFLLKSCYYTSLALANLYQLNSIAFPAISCGLQEFPPNEAAQVAIEAVRDFSHNIKDIRFVLFDRSIYSIFIQEWTNYVEQVNNAAQGIAYPLTTKMLPRSSSKPNVSSKEICVLCKSNAKCQNEPHRCSSCLNLNRFTLFSNILKSLRQAAEKSFNELHDECQNLKAIVDRYRLFYDPVQYFQHNIHLRDSVAEFYVQNHCDREIRYSIPIAILGDGNCFYNSFVALTNTTGSLETTITPIELRSRNIIELVLNRDAYKKKYEQFLPLCDPLESYVVNEMVKDLSYVANWDFFSMATVLNVNIISIYPRVNGDQDRYYLSFNNAHFTPLSTQTNENDTNKKINTTSINPKQVRILFSNVNKPLKVREWIPNHFVPLLNLF